MLEVLDEVASIASENYFSKFKYQIKSNLPKSKVDIIRSALDFVYYIRDYWAGDLSIGWCSVSALD